MENPKSQKMVLFILSVGLALMAIYFVSIGNKNVEPDLGSNVEFLDENGAEIEGTVVADGKYQVFSEEVFTEVVNKRRIYFFSATWCSTCKAAHQDFLKRAELLPDDVAVFKIDYDSNKDLRKKFGIPYQHTFVEVDGNGDKVQMWAGGAVDEMLEFMR